LLRWLRKQADLKQEYVARVLKVTQPGLSKAERSKVLSGQMAFRAADLFGIPMEAFWGGYDPDVPGEPRVSLDAKSREAVVGLAQALARMENAVAEARAAASEVREIAKDYGGADVLDALQDLLRDDEEE